MNRQGGGRSSAQEDGGDLFFSSGTLGLMLHFPEQGGHIGFHFLCVDLVGIKIAVAAFVQAVGDVNV